MMLFGRGQAGSPGSDGASAYRELRRVLLRNLPLIFATRLEASQMSTAERREREEKDRLPNLLSILERIA
jgi:hypothetical protein